MDEALAARLAEVEETYNEVEQLLADPDALSDQARFVELGRRHSELKPIVEAFSSYREALSDANEAAELAVEEIDPKMVEDLRRMSRERRAEAERLEHDLRLALVPKDPNDQKDVIVEIRAGTGGDEAALFAGDLHRMYHRFAELHGFKTDAMDSSESEAGGFSKVIFAVKGAGAYSMLKYEAGVHRVQRVPKTESQGRVHTSTATVAVLPEVEAVELDLDLNDVRVDVYRSSGPGGQSVNTTDSAVRLTYEPTGLVVTCQDEKSQLQNKEKAFRILRARLYQMEVEKQQSELAQNRRSQVGTGERSEKIRTYNFKENRVTDHRIGLTIKQLSTILDGDLDAFIEALSADEEARRLVEGD
jgi:peptide chain release factor 1